MRGSQVAVQSQGALAMGHGLLGALGEPKHKAQDDMRQGIVGASQGSAPLSRGRSREAAKCAALSSVLSPRGDVEVDNGEAGQRVDVCGIEIQGLLEKRARLRHSVCACAL